ncbi:AEC family transporter [Alphaproteobacteria bacterium HT1-32]|nr:AEC family transporter [Alphaproteobacteria bacterium HT1-32]
MFEEIAFVIVPVLLMAGVGYAISRSSLDIDSESLGRLVVMVGTPSLVFSTLTSPDLPELSLSGTVQAALLVTVCAGSLSAGFLLLTRQPIRSFLPSLTLPNSGNVGLPVVLLAFGQQGLAIGVAFFFVIALLQYSFVPAIMDGRFSLTRILKEPLVYALLAVFLFRLTDTTPHPIILQTTELLGGMMIPVMVILLGYSLGQLQVSDLRLSLILALARIVIGTTSGLLVIWLLGLQGVEAGSVFLMASMPCAMVIYLFALRYNRAPRRVAGLVVVSTLMTFSVLPVLLWIGIAISKGSLPFFSFLGGA